MNLCDKDTYFEPLYCGEDTIYSKIEKIATEIYRAKDVVYSLKAREEIERIERLNADHLPICMAKTQYSLSDDPKKLGRPEDYSITVKDVCLYNGAGFITVLLGEIMTMPGLPKKPNFEQIDLDCNGNVIGIF